MTDNALVLSGGQNLPEPHELVKMLRANVEALVLRERTARGEVHTPEDTYGVVRGLAAVHEGLTNYGRSFTTVGKEVLQHVEEELVEAVGEQDGLPLSGMRVPDTDGTTLVLTPKSTAAHSYDLDAILAVVATRAAVLDDDSAGWALLDAAEAADFDRFQAVLTGLVGDALRELLGIGKFDPQVTKVRVWLDQVAAADPKAASTVSSTYRKRAQYKGVEIKREQPKR